MAISSICAAEGCDKAVYCRGWCRAHYQRWWRHHDPLGGGTSNGELLRYFNDVVAPYLGEDCLIWPYSRAGNKYGEVRVAGKRNLVHRLVCERRHGPPPTPDHQAAHLCGKGHEGCVNPRHVVWKTPAENTADRLVHGTHNRGERHARVKLTEAGVLEIRRRLAAGETQAAIAADVGVTHSAISSIAIRKNWAWLE